ncbi:MAG TPA: hypothetical protein VK631_18030 [Solirubrobacteraceae bacterium]|nr:hypothetical protein [Solirubrobacteraceae bacterium]
MKIFAFLVALGLFVGSFVLFGYAFAVPAGWDMVLFFAGLLAVAGSLAIPFHLLEKFD